MTCKRGRGGVGGEERIGVGGEKKDRSEEGEEGVGREREGKGEEEGRGEGRERGGKGGREAGRERRRGGNSLLGTSSPEQRSAFGGLPPSSCVPEPQALCPAFCPQQGLHATRGGNQLTLHNNKILSVHAYTENRAIR